MRTTWDELAGRALARQFPRVTGRTPADVADAVALIGPIQSQTARSPYLALAARLPGVRYGDVSTAYDDLLIVRGSNLRGTVHTSTPADHALLEVATRTGQRALWARTLRLDQAALEQVWAGLEDYARDEWRTPAELLDHLGAWLAEHDPGHGFVPAAQGGRYLGFGHGGLIRRPLKGGWEGQGAPGYRTAAALLGDRCAVLADPDAALDALLRRHLAAYGPSSRHDLAWWSGLGLLVVDACLARQPDLVELVGPDERVYLDLPDAPGPIEVTGPRLLPEFDALMCGYDPPARARFVDPDHYPALWTQANGLMLAPLLMDGRLSGHWRLDGVGRRRSCHVTYFVGTRRPARGEVEECLAALSAAYGVQLKELTITR